MIIRLFHAKVRPGKQAEFKQALELISLPAFQSRNGMIAFYPGQPLGPSSNEFILVTVWKDAAALDQSRTKSDWARAVIPEEALPLIEEWNVHGYRSFGIMEPSLKPLFQNL